MELCSQLLSQPSWTTTETRWSFAASYSPSLHGQPRSQNGALQPATLPAFMDNQGDKMELCSQLLSQPSWTTKETRWSFAASYSPSLHGQPRRPDGALQPATLPAFIDNQGNKTEPCSYSPSLHGQLKPCLNRLLFTGPVPKDAERHWDVNLILFTVVHCSILYESLINFELIVNSFLRKWSAGPVLHSWSIVRSFRTGKLAF